jgi:SnoaL-like domain
MDARAVAERFRTAVEGGHVDGMVELLAPTVVFNSPVTFQPFRGSETVAHVLRAVSEVFEDFRYVDAMEGEEMFGLVFEARVGDRDVTGIDLFKATNDGRIAELTVMVRPLSGVIALAEAMGPKVEALAKG